jgi:Fe-S-cluster containining protein
MAKCRNCGVCCSYITTNIETPRDVEDFDHISWLLMHEDVSVYIDQDDGKWGIEVATPCRNRENGKCGIYDNRPKICAEHDPKDCEGSGGEGGRGDTHFSSPRDLREYLRNMLEAVAGEEDEERDRGR